jgi:hypothetical protein
MNMIDRGPIGPLIDAPATTAAATSRRYPSRSIAGTSSGVMIAASAWADPEMPDTTAEVSWQTYAIPPRRWPTREAAKAISRSDMPLAFITSATTRNIRITRNSGVPKPIVAWVVVNGTSGSLTG